MKTILLSFLCFFPLSLFAQSEVGNSVLSQSQQKKFIKIAKEVISLYGKAYLQAESKFYISGPKEFKAYDARFAKSEGRKYYSVQVSFYDKEICDKALYTTVNIWADSVEPESVCFPDNYGVPFHGNADSFSKQKRKKKYRQYNFAPRKVEPNVRY